MATVTGGNKMAKALAKRIRQAKSKTLEVGFLGGATYPDGTSVAMVAAANEFGVPERNQPPRPFFREAITNNQDAWIDIVTRLTASRERPEVIMEKLGGEIRDDIKQSIYEFTNPSLAASTITAKKAKGLSDADASKPLIEQHIMVNNVNYQVLDD